jgi:hypothetical protein
MGRVGLKYAAVLIALYLGVYYGTNSGHVIKAGADGSTEIIKAFQGRG